MLSAFDVIEKLHASEEFSGIPIRLKDGLIPYACSMLDWEEGAISLEARSWKISQFYGGLFRYNDRATIYYALDLSLCWRRFVVAKEIGHLLIDDENVFTSDPVSLVQGLIDGISNLDIASAVNADQALQIFSIEILLPRSEKPEIERMVSEGSTYLEIARHYKVPAKVVELYLSANYQRLHAAASALTPKK